ncbi:MazG nucleotide pyrophosphohydrolase domain-containing protein [Arthrobacter sp. CAU 1506]|uniref:MazG nucleotide pyrophosphohydrolase domain-containing protein n=1 Tax=Arthrobacter sp. CAU 1506 TaxID=2560052 RepID=UPI001F0D2B21|nr:MazG nucleotide pyrophosphohydrolase domain-containing protein [Arthrobacter sp. CAU 1506]
MPDSVPPSPGRRRDSTTAEPGPGWAVPRLLEVVAQLRDHCLWTAALTHESLIEYLVEEAHELAEAIETGHTGPADVAELRGELADVLFQVLLHARLQEERGHFDFDAVAAALTAKLIRRNRHVFRPDGSLQETFPETIAEIVASYDAVKAAEKPERSTPFDGVPTSLPALTLAAKSLDRARRSSVVDQSAESRPSVVDQGAQHQPSVGDQSVQHCPSVVDQSAESRPSIVDQGAQRRVETQPVRHNADPAAKGPHLPEELRAAFEGLGRSPGEAEVGEALFAVVRRAAEAGVDPEQALRAAVRRFQQRVTEENSTG